jgi:hypothetical protein
MLILLFRDLDFNTSTFISLNMFERRLQGNLIYRGILITEGTLFSTSISTEGSRSVL